MLSLLSNEMGTVSVASLVDLSIQDGEDSPGKAFVVGFVHQHLHTAPLYFFKEASVQSS